VEAAFSRRRHRFLHFLFVFERLDVPVAHVGQRARQKSPGAAGRIKQQFAGMRIDTVRHKHGHGSRCVIFTGVPGALQVIKDLFVDVAEMLALREIIEVHLVDFVDDRPHKLAGLHVVIGVLEHVAHDAAAVTLFTCRNQLL
jgi:hypothetical protein